MRTQTWGSYSSYFFLPLRLEAKASFMWIPMEPGSRFRERIRHETQITTMIKTTHNSRGFGANIHSFYESPSSPLIYPPISINLPITHLPNYPPHTYSPPINSPPTPLPIHLPIIHPPILPATFAPICLLLYTSIHPYTHTPINLPSVHLNSFIPPCIYPFINNCSSSSL